MKQMIADMEPSPRAVLLEAATQDDLDVTSAEMETKPFHTTALCSPTHAALLMGSNHTIVGMACIAEDHIFPTLDAAVRHIEVAS